MLRTVKCRVDDDDATKIVEVNLISIRDPQKALPIIQSPIVERPSRQESNHELQGLGCCGFPIHSIIMMHPSRQAYVEEEEQPEVR